MNEPLAPWSNFYVMTGSSAAALTGLVFVVLSLVAQRQQQQHTPPTRQGFTAYTTPTIVHFCFALFVSGTFSAPWHSVWPAFTLLSVAGLGGVLYEFRIVYGIMRRVTAYQADAEDWIWYAVLPMLSYLALAATPIVYATLGSIAIFVPAAVTMTLLFIGIHNAWDVVTFIAIDFSDEEQ